MKPIIHRVQFQGKDYLLLVFGPFKVLATQEQADGGMEATAAVSAGEVIQHGTKIGSASEIKYLSQLTDEEAAAQAKITGMAFEAGMRRNSL